MNLGKEQQTKQYLTLSIKDWMNSTIYEKLKITITYYINDIKISNG